MDIVKVSTKRLFKQFLNLPHQLYKNDLNWVPPLRSEQKKLFTPQKNPTLAHCEYCLFVVFDKDRVVGRVAAFIDNNYNNYWQCKIGFFGSYECVENDGAAQILLNTCKRWLAKREMTHMRGPISFETQNWGLVVEGYDRPPIMSPYNPAYYNRQMEAFGLVKIKDLQVFAGNSKTYEIPERFVRHLDHITKKYRLSIRKVDMKNFKQEVLTIIELTNASLANNWGFAPITDDEARAVAKDLKQIINPEVVLIVESNSRPIGFSIALPDVNTILKNLNGRLFPFGIFRLAFGLKKINHYRHWALGILPEYHRRGIDTLLYARTYEILKPQNVYLEANYILEDNYAMKDAVIKLGLKKVRTYRIYEMIIS